MSPPHSTRATDDILLAIANRRRRIVLETLSDSDAHEVPFERLVSDITGRLEANRESLREEVAIELRHAHLPKLDELGLIDYDRQRRAVRYQTDDEVESLLACIRQQLPQPA